MTDGRMFTAWLDAELVKRIAVLERERDEARELCRMLMADLEKLNQKEAPRGT